MPTSDQEWSGTQQCARRTVGLRSIYGVGGHAYASQFVDRLFRGGFIVELAELQYEAARCR